MSKNVSAKRNTCKIARIIQTEQKPPFPPPPPPSLERKGGKVCGYRKIQEENLEFVTFDLAGLHKNTHFKEREATNTWLIFFSKAGPPTDGRHLVRVKQLIFFSKAGPPTDDGHLVGKNS